MDLPKIKNEDLPEKLRELLGDADAEFDAIVDPMDVIHLQNDPDAYYDAAEDTAKKFVESREKLQRLRSEQRLLDSEDSE